MTKRKYTIVFESIGFIVHELNSDDEISFTIVYSIDKDARERAKLSMSALIAKALKDGYPKPDDQEQFYLSYIKNKDGCVPRIVLCKYCKKEARFVDCSPVWQLRDPLTGFECCCKECAKNIPKLGF